MTQRTLTQQASYRLLLKDYADELNDRGYDFKAVVQLPVIFTPENVHEYMFKPVMKILYPDIASTTELSTTQMMEVYETFNAAMAEKFKFSKEWPTRFNR